MLDRPRLRHERRDATTEVELIDFAGVPADPAVVRRLADELDELIRRPELADSSVHLAADHPAGELDPLPELVAEAAGLVHRRDLLQLRRPLPVPSDHPLRASAPTIAVRPFRSAADDGPAWIRANNRAFAHHPDQGAETTSSLADRLAQPWFDPAGFLLLDDPDRPGELAGFCWTKQHPAQGPDPELGEIYVIGVDPSHQGEGLGPALVLAGLDHLTRLGLAVANLYVEADNEPARRLYDRLGFTVHQRRRVYSS